MSVSDRVEQALNVISDALYSEDMDYDDHNLDQSFSYISKMAKRGVGIHPYKDEVMGLVYMLVGAGYTISAVNDGEERVKVVRPEDAVDTVLSVDESTIAITKNGHSGYIYVVLGNEPGVSVCDYSAHADLLSELDALTSAHNEAFEERI